MKSILSSLLAILVLSLAPLAIQAQEATDRRFSLDVLGGLSASDFFSLSPTASINGQIRVKERWVIGVTYEHYFHDSTVGSTTGDQSSSVSVLVDYNRGYSAGIYAGVDVIARPKLRMAAAVGPTFSGNGGAITTLIRVGSENRIEKRDFSNDGSIGVGIWLRSEYDFTDQFYGVVQLSGHENLADKLTRGSLRVGVGVRI